MGILARPLEMMTALNLHKGHSVCELGDQYVTATAKPHVLAKEWYEARGCTYYVAIDANGKGDVIHDLNRALKSGLFYELIDKTLDGAGFDLVTDFGTGEHVFDQAAVWRTLHLLTRVGGYIAFDRPTAGYLHHCYYLMQAHIIRDIAEANHYDVVALEEAVTSRGELVRGVLRKTRGKKFIVPQQSRYKKKLVI